MLIFGPAIWSARELLSRKLKGSRQTRRGRTSLKQILAEVEKQVEGTERDANAAESSSAETTKARQHRPSFFTNGSTKGNVLAVQGTPTSVLKLSGEEIWSYGYTCSVTFDWNGIVT